MHGSSAQGLGQVIGEEVRYDAATGQLLTGSFMDYVMPRADDMPAIRSEFIQNLPTTNPLGVKGGGEAGNTAVPAAVVNALVDALAEFGISDLPLPAPAHRIWTAIEQARRRRAE